MTKTIKDIDLFIQEKTAAGEIAAVSVVLANDIRRRMRECLGEHELTGIDYLNTFIYADPGICASHDYIDANMPVYDAVGDFCEREIGLPRDVYAAMALSEEDSKVVDLMQIGWDRIKAEGFSTLWLSTEDEELRRNAGLVILRAPNAEGNPLGREIVTRMAGAYTALVGDDRALEVKVNTIISGRGTESDVSEYLDMVKARQSAAPKM